MTCKKSTLCICFLAAIACITCTRAKDSDSSTDQLFEIDYRNADKDMLMSSIIDTIEYIPLFENFDEPITSDQLQIKSNGIYLLDRRRNKIQAFNNDGHGKFVIKAIGQTEREYIEIACMAITDSSIFIADNFSNKINEYSTEDGAFKASYKAPIVIGDMRPLKNGGFLLAEMPWNGVKILEGSDNHRLYITDDTFKIVSSHYSYGKHRDKFGMRNYLSDNDSIIIYACRGYNGFTKISAIDGSIIGNIPVITNNPPDNELIADMSISDAADLAEQREWQYLASPPVIANNYIRLLISTGITAYPTVYDLNTGKFYFNNRNNMHNNLMDPDMACGDSFYRVYNFGAEFLDEQLAMGFNPPPHVADSVIRNDGAVLLRYKMK